MKPNTIQARVLKHLRKKGNISTREIYLEYHAGSPTKVISELRRKGYGIVPITKHHEVTGQRYVRYTLPQEDQST